MLFSSFARGLPFRYTYSALTVPEEVDSAISNSQNQNEKDAIKNLERAHKRLQFINGKVSLDVVDEVKESVDEVVNKIEDEG